MDLPCWSGSYPGSIGVHHGNFLGVDFVPVCSGGLLAFGGFNENAPVSGGAVAVAVVIVPCPLLEGSSWFDRAASAGADRLAGCQVSGLCQVGLRGVGGAVEGVVGVWFGDLPVLNEVVQLEGCQFVQLGAELV